MILSEHNDLWYRCRPFTEYIVGSMLEEDCNLSKLNYYKLPWTGIVREKRTVDLPRAMNGFPSVTMCQYAEFPQLIDEFKKLGIGHVFSPHCSFGSIDGIRTYPIAHLPINVVKNPYPIEARQLLYSFVGMLNSGIREHLKRIEHPNDAMMVFRDRWNHEAKEQDGAFIRSLKSSKFILCPRGWGAGTIRFWEAIQSGCIPVLFDDLDLPPDQLWGQAIVRHDDPSTLEDRLRSYSLHQIKEKQNNIAILAKRYLGRNMINPILRQFKITRVYPFHSHSIRAFGSLFD